MNDELAAVLDRIKAAGRIDADDVLAMRAQVYKGEQVAVEDLEALADLDRAVPADRAPEWGDFFAEAMTDFVVRQQDPEDYVDEVKADWLMRTLGAAQPLSADAGLEALGRILKAASQVPPALITFALDAAKAAVTGKGRIEGADVAMLRQMVFAGGGDACVGVSRAEAETLFAIDAACRGAANDAGWPEFFAGAVADCLTAVSPVRNESLEEAKRDEAWLDSRDTLGGFFKGMAKAPDVGGALKEILHPFADEDAEWRDAEAETEAAEATATVITDEKAKWLVGHLGQGQLSDGERRLLGLLKVQAAEVSPLLKPLLDAAPQAAAPAEDEPTAPIVAHDEPGPFPEAPPAEPILRTPAPAPAGDEPIVPAVFGQRRTAPR